MKIIILSFADAWEMLLEWALPKRISDFVEATAMDREEPEPLLTQLWFPVIAAGGGLIVMLFAALLSNLPTVSAGLIFAFAMTLLSELRDKGHATGTLASFSILKADGHSLPETIFNLDADLRTINGAIGAMVLTLTVILKFSCFFLMSFYGFAFWIIPILVLGYAMQAELATLPTLRSGEPFIEIADNQRFYVWGITTFFILFILLKAPILSLLSLGMVFVAAMIVKRFVNEHLGGITGNAITLIGYLTELTILTLGAVCLSGSA
jgi:cobalamin synthase